MSSETGSMNCRAALLFAIAALSFASCCAEVYVSLPGEEKPRVFAGNPLHKDFHALRWLGFQSNASGGVKYWIDDFKLTP